MVGTAGGPELDMERLLRAERHPGEYPSMPR